jgi:uncharacterized protein YpmB
MRKKFIKWIVISVLVVLIICGAIYLMAMGQMASAFGAY